MKNQQAPTHRCWPGPTRPSLPPVPTQPPLAFPAWYARGVHAATTPASPLPVTPSPPQPNRAPARVNIRPRRAIRRLGSPGRARGNRRRAVRAGRATGRARSPRPESI